MIIANISISKNEDHSIYAEKYGGGSVFCKYARLLKNEGSNTFLDFAPQECFNNVKINENSDKCFIITDSQIERIKKGEPLKDILVGIKNVDIFIFNKDEFFILNLVGLKATQVLWMAFVNQSCHPNIPHLFIYSEDQKPLYNPEKTQGYLVKIGKPCQKNFHPSAKEDFVFQCTRNDETMDSIYLAKLCKRFKIKGVFGGPIFNNYPLLGYIDNKYTFYVGVLNEQEKLNYSKRARLYNCIQNWDTIFSLSAIEALGQGTPIIARNRGCFKYLLKDKINGFYYDDKEESFFDIWEQSVDINQYNCYNSALEYSEVEMVESFYRNFEYILNKNNENSSFSDVQ